MKSIAALVLRGGRGNNYCNDISRHISSSLHFEMSRRACKIADRKAAQTLKRDKINNKIAKEIAKAAREGGTNTTSNLVLAGVLQRAKELNVSKELIERNMKKAKDSDQQSFSEITYEVYGFGGVGIVIEVLTDNLNRSSVYIREVVKKCRAKMADSGSVLFKFKRTGVISVKPTGGKANELLIAAIDAGAEDVIEPHLSEDSVSAEDSFYKVITTPEKYVHVRSKLKEANFHIDADNSGLELVSDEQVEVDDEAMELNKMLIDKLMEIGDVDAVYSNQNS